MNILVACEFSDIVSAAFRKKGHQVLSCDLLPSEGTGQHYQGDVMHVIDEGWDMMIAHPPCTYLCVPGAHYLHKQEGRWEKMLEAKELFMKILESRIKKLCVENPLPHRYAELPKYSQIIHPWMFGQEFTKRTCLWLKGLPELEPTKIVNKGDRYIRVDGSTSNSKWYAKSNAKERSRTFQGIADAMAEQWG